MLVLFQPFLSLSLSCSLSLNFFEYLNCMKSKICSFILLIFQYDVKERKKKKEKERKTRMNETQPKKSKFKKKSELFSFIVHIFEQDLQSY